MYGYEGTLQMGSQDGLDMEHRVRPRRKGLKHLARDGARPRRQRDLHPPAAPAHHAVQH